MTKISSFEAIRKDTKSPFEDNFIGRVVKINSVKSSLDVRVKGAVDSVLPNIPIVGAESIFNVNVGDNVAISRFSGTWVALGVVGKARRNHYRFWRMETDRSVTSYGDLVVHGFETTYDATYHYGEATHFADVTGVADIDGNDPDLSGWGDIGYSGDLKPTRSGTEYTGYICIMADADSDGDYDALTASAWEDSTKSGSGTINWNTVFGVPADAKAVLLYVGVKDATQNTNLTLRAKSTTTRASGIARITVANVLCEYHMTVPVAADGTSYYSFSAAMDNTYVRVVGWFI